jgi:hypothetical protein
MLTGSLPIASHQLLDLLSQSHRGVVFQSSWRLILIGCVSAYPFGKNPSQPLSREGGNTKDVCMSTYSHSAGYVLVDTVLAYQPRPGAGIFYLLCTALLKISGRLSSRTLLHGIGMPRLRQPDTTAGIVGEHNSATFWLPPNASIIFESLFTAQILACAKQYCNSNC